MSKNLNQINNGIKGILKKYNFKKRSILMGMAILVISCGGGGGGGIGTTTNSPSSGTNRPTATATVTPTIAWNNTELSYNRSNPHNNSNTTITGTGVKVGIIDVGFENSAFASDLTEKFGSRLTKFTVPGFTASSTENDDHGITVAALAAGRTEGIAKGVSVFAIDAGNHSSDGTRPEPTLEMYQELKNRGVTIYNQSFGIDAMVTDFNSSRTSTHYYGHQIGSAMLQFYRNEVNNGALFVWAAGNDSSDTQPTLEGGLPYFETDLQKGWINVVGLTSREESRMGDTDWSNLTPLSPAGVAKMWSVTAISDHTFTIRGRSFVGGGSSFAAPIVTGTAALIKEKYPWMDANLIRQTILSTATDIGERGVDSVYGWGLLNIDKALKGPSLFDTQLALGPSVIVNIPSGVYTFSNDISGNAGLEKNGAGELILSGNSTFLGDTNVNAGRLRVNGTYVSSLNVRRRAILSTNNARINNNITNDGTLENRGSTQVNGNYESLENSRVVAELNSNLHVTGRVSLNNSKLEIKPEENGERKYITANGTNQEIITSDNRIEGKFETIDTDEMLNAKINQNENSVSTKISRKNVLDYVK
ncbi:S8 family serine peptidase, partial [Leptotrichia sp. oral taxon 879]|uniref:S8 family serine peptidase n=1 Tax=Leptotrichia sp. oral taxon 879 TaxID=1227267 RepID=UPI0003ADDCAD